MLTQLIERLIDTPLGIGFWLVQAVFVVAAIATAIKVERERQRDSTGSTSQRRHVPVEPGAPFSIQEQDRLLRLRQRVHESKAGTGRLYDDLIPDPIARSVVTLGDEPESTVHHGPPRSLRSAPRVPMTAVLLAAGLALVVLGGIGIWRSNAAMDALQPPTGLTLVDRFVPGPLAHPNRYFAAVNSSSSTAVAISTVALLDQKRAMDRWEAVVASGLALLLSFAAQRTRRNEASPIGVDLVGVFSLVALLSGGLSFFELP